jgi:hypothetical protein
VRRRGLLQGTDTSQRTVSLLAGAEDRRRHPVKDRGFPLPDVWVRQYLVTCLRLQYLAIEQHNALTVDLNQAGVGKGAQRAADHLPDRA